MTNEEIKELVGLVVESGVAEIEVQRGEDRVRIRRVLATRGEKATPSSPAPPTQPAAAAAPPPAQAPQTSTTVSVNDIVVKSPIVGTYYDQAKPGDPPFVKVGDSVEHGQVLCIIESMKLMNEIEAEVAGVVVSKLMENGRPVEYGEALFLIRPR